MVHDSGKEKAMQHIEGDFYSLPETMKLLGLGRARIYQLVKDGMLRRGAPTEILLTKESVEECARKKEEKRKATLDRAPKHRYRGRW